MQRFAYSCTSYYFDIVLFTVLYKELYCTEKIAIRYTNIGVYCSILFYSAHAEFSLCGGGFVIIRNSYAICNRIENNILLRVIFTY